MVTWREGKGRPGGGGKETIKKNALLEEGTYPSVTNCSRDPRPNSQVYYLRGGE